MKRCIAISVWMRHTHVSKYFVSDRQSQKIFVSIKHKKVTATDKFLELGFLGDYLLFFPFEEFSVVFLRKGE